MTEKEPFVYPPDKAFDRAKDLFGFINSEEHPVVTSEPMIRSKTFMNFEARGELWGGIDRKLGVKIIPRWNTEPVLSFSLEPLHGATEIKLNYPLSVEIEEHSLPVQISPIEINEEKRKQLAGALVNWLETIIRTGEIDPSYSGTPTVSVKNFRASNEK